MTTTLTGKNQTMVPDVIARQLGMTAGTVLDWTLSGLPNQIIVTVKPTRRKLLERVREIGRKHKKPGQYPIGDILREREEDDRLREEAIQ